MIVGIDEVGTGAFAGPVLVVAAGFELNNSPDNRITDSKKLSDVTRKLLVGNILQNLAYLDIEFISAEQISDRGLAECMDHALQGLCDRASEVAESVIVDGIRKFSHKNVHSFPKADFTYWQVSAASILAKVWRDNEMDKLAKLVPSDYGWEINKGYGTKTHREAIKLLGITSQHRTSFNLGQK